MKENLKKFREEAKKLEESEALKEARGKFSKVLEKSDSGVIKEKLDEIKESEFVKVIFGSHSVCSNKNYSLCLPTCSIICLSVCPCQSPFVSPPSCQFAFVSVFLFVSVPFCQSFSLSVSRSVFLSVGLSVSLSLCQTFAQYLPAFLYVSFLVSLTSD